MKLKLKKSLSISRNWRELLFISYLVRNKTNWQQEQEKQVEGPILES